MDIEQGDPEHEDIEQGDIEQGEPGDLGGRGAMVRRFPDPPGICRAVRRRADLSQRELAGRTGLSRSTVARIEAGRLVPSMAVVGRLLAVADLVLVAVDPDGRVVVPMADPPQDDLRDGAGRRYPSHLDVIVDPEGEQWWGAVYGLAAPPETFRRDRARRDVARTRSRWEVRVKLLRHVPPPPTVAQWLQWRP